MSEQPEQKARTVVLLSGGIDSATLLYWVLDEIADSEDVLAVSFDYEQRHKKEIHSAMALCAATNVAHKILQGITFPKSMLTDPSAPVPNVSYDELEGLSPTYVPFRNGMFIARATAEALGQKAIYVAIASHAEDAQGWAYPDCSPEFNGAMANAVYIGSYQKVRLLAPFQHMMKSDVIQKGALLNVPFEKTWSCYKGEQLHCGTCPTCRARKEAFHRAGVDDPTLYMG